MRQFLADLDARGELLHVDRTVDPRHELAAIAVAAQREGEEALLFHSVAGSEFPVAINLYGSHARLCRLIGAEGLSFAPRWLELQRQAMAPMTRPVESDDFQACKLSDLPLLTYHGRDGGPYFTSAIYAAKEPDTGAINLSFHRSMFIGDDGLRVRLGGTHDLTRYQAKAEERGEPLEAALILSAPPEIFLAACTSLPYGESELGLAANLRGGPVPMRKCRTIDLEVPAEADIVVEGRFLPRERRDEGPFGEFMGYYVEVGPNHVFEVTAVTYRPGATMHGLVCGSTEDLRPLEAATAARIYDHVSKQVPGVLDVSCRPNVMITIIRLKKQYEGHGKHALLAALGSHLDYNKVCIAVDEDVDIYDLDDVMWAYLTRGRADTRAMILNDIPGFYRDPHKDHWGRLIIDATAPWGREAEFVRKSVPGADTIDLSAWLRAPGR